MHEEVKRLWLDFEDLPYNSDSECIEVEWMEFPAGTHREEIWHWFEKTFNIPIYKLLYEFDEIN